jgi:Domain of unknown function (DUF397)
MIDAPDTMPVRWNKSSRSGANGNCVETADIGGQIAVRDSKNPDGPRLSLSHNSWRGFVADVRDGLFDTPGGA